MRDELTVNLLPGMAERESRLTLRDVYGKPHVYIKNPRQQTRIPVSHLQAGVYTLEWNSGKQRQTQKVLILR